MSQSEDFHQLIECAETAWEYDKRLGKVGKPELAHEEVVKFERELGGDIGVRTLLEWQADVQPDGFAAGLASSAIGRFHDAGATPGADDEAPPRRFRCARFFGY